jgi:deoxyribodipyrimidine photo-lyase
MSAAGMRARLIRRVAGASEEGLSATTPVLYWMSRDQRVHDNWALLYAREVALKASAPLGVVLCLAPSYPGGTLRAYDFLLKGLRECEAILEQLGVPFFLLPGDPPKVLPQFAADINCGLIVTDFNPMPGKKAWLRSMLGTTAYPPVKGGGGVDVTSDDLSPTNLPACVGSIVEVDAHNIVPCWVTSDKKETAARTIRPKLQRLLPHFLKDYPAPLTKANCGDTLAKWNKTQLPTSAVNWNAMYKSLEVDRLVTPVTWIRPGETAAMGAAKKFARSDEALMAYHEKRNDPNAGAQSQLSPYLHFGHISAQRVALMAQQHADKSRSADVKRGVGAFIEELVIRRELSDNFVYYSDAQPAWPEWALKSLKEHEADPRDHVYTLEQLEFGSTYDTLWNAAQHEMVLRGKMHGFMRMYWAKKILEWSPNAAEAFRVALYLNDKYFLDGRDPNGIVGVAWCIYGVHDMGWKERPIFGKVRYMNHAGCKRKFNVESYVNAMKVIVGMSMTDQPELAKKCFAAVEAVAAHGSNGGQEATKTRTAALEHSLSTEAIDRSAAPRPRRGRDAAPQNGACEELVQPRRSQPKGPSTP